MQKKVVVRVVNLHKGYTSKEGLIQALRGISFDINEGEFFTILGPSGCGKTTALRSIAGLEDIDKGEIIIGGKVMASGRKFIPTYQRPIGMVFQSYAIWPHMTVAENVAFPLKNMKKKYSTKELARMVDEVLALVQLEGLADRPAPNLSGGQQQRLALARALVYNPTVLLLDEPLSNLDAKLREEMRLELKSLVRRVGITTVYVTHDQLEALVLSDRIILMRDGQIIEEGNPYDLYMYPRHYFTATFFGVNNILEGRVIQIDRARGMAQVETELGRPITAVMLDMSVEIGEKVQVAIRPENISLDKGNSSAKPIIYSPEDINKLEGIVKEAVFLGDCMDYRVSVKNVLIRLRANLESRVEQNAVVTIMFSFKHASILHS